MSQHDRAVDSAMAYHEHVLRGLTTSHDHLQAATLAADVADVEYLLAAEADTAGERRMFLTAGDKARKTRDYHELSAEITAVGERVLGLSN